MIFDLYGSVPTFVWDGKKFTESGAKTLISDVLRFDRLWYGEPDTTSDAINYAKFFSRLVLKGGLIAAIGSD